VAAAGRGMASPLPRWRSPARQRPAPPDASRRPGWDAGEATPRPYPGGGRRHGATRLGFARLCIAPITVWWPLGASFAIPGPSPAPLTAPSPAIQRPCALFTPLCMQDFIVRLHSFCRIHPTFTFFMSCLSPLPAIQRAFASRAGRAPAIIWATARVSGHPAACATAPQRLRKRACSLHRRTRRVAPSAPPMRASHAAPRRSWHARDAACASAGASKRCAPPAAGSPCRRVAPPARWSRRTVYTVHPPAPSHGPPHAALPSPTRNHSPTGPRPPLFCASHRPWPRRPGKGPRCRAPPPQSPCRARSLRNRDTPKRQDQPPSSPACCSSFPERLRARV